MTAPEWAVSPADMRAAGGAMYLGRHVGALCDALGVAVGETEGVPLGVWWELPTHPARHHLLAALGEGAADAVLALAERAAARMTPDCRRDAYYGEWRAKVLRALASAREAREARDWSRLAAFALETQGAVLAMNERSWVGGEGAAQAADLAELFGL